MCTAQAVKEGLQDIATNKRTILLVWLTNLILALTVALPLFSWLGKMSRTVEAEAMLQGFSLPLLVDLAQYDFGSILMIVGTLVFWLAVCASLVSTFVSGGVLSVLVFPGREPFAQHFFAGAGRYFLRFLRLLVLGVLCGGVVLVGINLLLGFLVARLSQEASEMAPLFLGLGQGVLNLLIGTVFLLALHYARIDTVVEDRTEMGRTYLSSMRFVLRNILRVFALIAFFALLTGVIYVLYVALRTALPTTSWLLILVLMASQQFVVLARSAFQVGLYGAEVELFLLRRPKAADRETVAVLEDALAGPPAPVLASELEPAEQARTDTE